MKPFTINRNSWHYKLNRKFMNEYGVSDRHMEYQWEPRHNDFCSYWRATIFRMVAVAFIAAVLTVFVTMIGFAAYTHPWETLRTVGIFIGVVAGFIGFVMLFALASTSKEKLNESLFVQKYKAHKSKICPMVEYKQ
jgi:uncharacterized membrane protein (DUF485 family)